MEQQMSEERLEQVKALFQESYKIIYSDGAFDAMADQAEADGNIIPAVSQLIGTIINSTVKDAGVTDLGVLFGLAVMLIGDLLEALQQLGIENQAGDFEAIINEAMMIVLSANPNIAEAVKADPTIQQAMAEMGGPAQPATQPQPQAPQGVMGAANANQT